MNKSRKIGVIIFIVVAIVIIVFGYLYLSGTYYGFNNYKAEVYFYDVSGLKPGSAVYIRGLERGKVVRVDLTEDGQMMRVQFILDKRVKLTEDTKFIIRSLSYFGTDRVLIIAPGTGPVMTKNTKFYGSNEVIGFENIFVRVDEIIKKLEGGMIDNSIKSIKDELFSKLDTVAKGFNMPMSSITSPIEQLVIKLDTISNYLKSEGTVKKLVTSEDLYNEIRETNSSLRALLDDIKANPKRYFTVKLF